MFWKNYSCFYSIIKYNNSEFLRIGTHFEVRVHIGICWIVKLNYPWPVPITLHRSTPTTEGKIKGFPGQSRALDNRSSSSKDALQARNFSEIFCFVLKFQADIICIIQWCLLYYRHMVFPNLHRPFRKGRNVAPVSKVWP